MDFPGLKNLCELADEAYEELRQSLLNGGQFRLTIHQLALLAARSRSLYVLIRDLLLLEGCSNETRILVRPLIEDSVRIMWVCDPQADGTVEERLFAIQFDGRLGAYGTLHDVSMSKLKKLRDKDKLDEQAWWPNLVQDLIDTASSLGVRFGSSQAAKDVLPVPHRSKIYESNAASGYDLKALDKVYVDTCSATHRDGHDLNRFWIPYPEGTGHVLVDQPYQQPEHYEGARYTLLMVASLTFLTSLAAIRTHLGITTPTDAKLERLTSIWSDAAEEVGDGGTAQA